MNIVGHESVLWRLQNTFIWLAEFEDDGKEQKFVRVLFASAGTDLSDGAVMTILQSWRNKKEKKQNKNWSVLTKPAGTSHGFHDNEIKLD